MNLVKKIKRLRLQEYLVFNMEILVKCCMQEWTKDSKNLCLKFMPQYKEYVENFNWAFDRGCLWSNMGGVEGSLDDGLTKFKDNFNPTINEMIGEFDIPVYPFM